MSNWQITWPETRWGQGLDQVDFPPEDIVSFGRVPFPWYAGSRVLLINDLLPDSICRRSSVHARAPRIQVSPVDFVPTDRRVRANLQKNSLWLGHSLYLQHYHIYPSYLFDVHSGTASFNAFILNYRIGWLLQVARIWDSSVPGYCINTIAAYYGTLTLAISSQFSC